MLQQPDIEFVPWDSAVFGLQCYELKHIDDDLFKSLKSHPGHYTVRSTPLLSKKIFHDHGFYYCDTLVEPYCDQGHFVCFTHDDVFVTKDVSKERLVKICSGAFSHGRFHCDFNIPRELADKRYDNWLVQLFEAGKVYGLCYKSELIGFIGVERNKLVLHAIAEEYRGQGLAKYLWSPVCLTLFQEGYAEVASSVSASNSAVVNLYARLGFRFRNPVDIYHRLVR